MQHIRQSFMDGKRVGIITIERREFFNALDVQTARDLRQAGLQLAREAQVKVVVLRGSGGIFCSGADLKYIRAGGEARELGYLHPEARAVPEGYGERFKQILEYLHSTISEIRRAPKIFIAAVDGVAAAGGLGLAMACDVVLASERSVFEYAYFKTGLCGAESSTFFLPKLLGLRRAMELALFNPRLGAAQAQAMGLVSAVYADGDFDAQVAAQARRLSALPARAVAEAKRLMNEAMGADRLDYHLDRELEALVATADSADFAEGIDAFFTKRSPHFCERLEF